MNEEQRKRIEGIKRYIAYYKNKLNMNMIACVEVSDFEVLLSVIDSQESEIKRLRAGIDGLRITSVMYPVDVVRHNDKIDELLAGKDGKEER